MSVVDARAALHHTCPGVHGCPEVGITTQEKPRSLRLADPLQRCRRFLERRIRRPPHVQTESVNAMILGRFYPRRAQPKKFVSRVSISGRVLRLVLRDFFPEKS